MGTFSYKFPNPARRRLARAATGLLPAVFVSFWLTGLPAPAFADGHKIVVKDSIKGDLIQKRFHGTGKGMPSIRGPFPDTVGLQYLGQLTNAELGVARLVRSGSAFLSDIWGWTSPDTDDEYAIVGNTSGVAFVRVTDPAAPEYLGIIPTTDTGTQRNF